MSAAWVTSALSLANSMQTEWRSRVIALLIHISWAGETATRHAFTFKPQDFCI